MFVVFRWCAPKVASSPAQLDRPLYKSLSLNLVRSRMSPCEFHSLESKMAGGQCLLDTLSTRQCLAVTVKQNSDQLDLYYKLSSKSHRSDINLCIFDRKFVCQRDPIIRAVRPPDGLQTSLWCVERPARFVRFMRTSPPNRWARWRLPNVLCSPIAAND